MGPVKRAARIVAISTVGSLLVVIGVVLLFLPGPGLLLIVAGLAVFSIEFVWAERLRERTVRRLREARDTVRTDSHDEDRPGTRSGDAA